MADVVRLAHHLAAHATAADQHHGTGDGVHLAAVGEGLAQQLVVAVLGGQQRNDAALFMEG